MKRRNLVVSIIVLASVLLTLWAVSIGAADPIFQSEAPSLPPSPPPEGFDPIPRPAIPALDKELNEREALEKAFEFDSLGVKWQEPWSPDKVGEDSERVTINLYNSRSEAAKASGRDTWSAPHLEESAGKVWVITIKGTANANDMMPQLAEDELVSSITYEISARTGQLLAVRTNLLTEK